ncbi:MAG: enoyl-CoA hydratase/isomerase family protein [Novosphingobium sp.]|nr:enoyl-CoA hydratase/isomerase family protein [Novosphingobium sp.]
MTTTIEFGALAVELLDNGVAKVTFSRPPVNAFSISVYENLGQLTEWVEGNDDVRAIVITAPDDARAWCGGADLNDFKGMTKEKRNERYAFINQQLPRFHAIDRPTIAAINGAAIGIGMVLSSLCDFRVAAEDAKFAVPEVDYGLLSGGAGRFVALRLPEPKLREMLYTGRKFTAREIEPTGFFNYVVPCEEVLPRALALAAEVASKDSTIMRARKRDSLLLEGSEWFDAYLRAQQGSANLVERPASHAGVEKALGKA